MVDIRVKFPSQYLFLNVRTELVAHDAKSLVRHTKVFLPPLGPKQATLYCIPPMSASRFTPHSTTSNYPGIVVSQNRQYNQPSKRLTCTTLHTL